MKIKIAVVGLGIGKAHIHYYKQIPDVEIIGIVDTNSDVLKETAEKYNLKPFNSVEELLKTEIPDGVSICTPPSSHLKLTQIFASKNVHILCEKPMAPRISDCEKMIEVCEKNKVFLMIGFKKRFSPTYLFLKNKFENDFGIPKWIFAKFALGRVEKEWFWDEKDGGGPIVENTVHVIDLLHFLIGEVKSVYAEGDNLFMPQFSSQIDTAIFTIRFKNGAIAGVGAGYGSEWGFAKEEVTFTTEKAVCEVRGFFDNPQNLQYIYRNNPSKVFEEKFDNADGFSGEIEHFVNCIKNNKKPAVDGNDGLYALKVCLSVKKSAKNKKPVSL
jgi:predicted dehydrogenase